MENYQTNKPLYSLTVGEYIELNRQLYMEFRPSNFPVQREDRNDLVDIQEASVITKLAVPTIYAKTSKNLIPFFKNNKKLMFKRSELIKWIESGRKKTVAEIKIEIENHKSNRK